MNKRGPGANRFDVRMAKALSHPVRVQALRILSERVASPSTIAEELGMPVGDVSHHVRLLLQLQCIEEVDVRPVRGALEHFYRSTRRPLVEPHQAACVPASVRHALGGKIARVAFEDISKSLASDAFDPRTDQHLSRTELVLDQQGWDNVYAMLLEVLNGAFAEESAAAERLKNGETGGPEVRSRLSMFHHTAPPAD